MKIVCDRQELAEALHFASAVVPARTTRPLLSNICLVAEPDGARLLATDLEVGLEVRLRTAQGDALGIGVDVVEHGRALLPAAAADSIVRELAGDKVELAAGPGVVSLAANGSAFRLAVGDPDEFPALPGPGSGVALEVPRALLADMLRRTAFASAVDDGQRYALHGVLFELERETLRLVATDGKRLAICEREVANPRKLEAQRVVPNKAVRLLARLAAAEDAEDEQLALAFRDNHLVATSARVTLVAQLAAGACPPWREVVPRDLDKRAELDAGALASALRQVALVTTRDSASVRFAFADGALTLSARSQAVGEGRVVLPATYEGEPLEIAFNPQYLLDALKVLGAPGVVLGMRNATTPCVLRGAGGGDGFVYLAMPVDLT